MAVSKVGPTHNWVYHPPCPCARYIQLQCWLIPLRCPVVIVVGKPIAVPRLLDGENEPTDLQLQQVQAEYIESLQAIYDKYKHIYD